MHRPHSHPRLQQRLSRSHEWWVYGSSGTLAASGIGWLVCHFLVKSAALGPNPLEVWWLRLHGAALVGFLIVFGTVMPAHVVYGWRHRLNRGTGIAMLLVIGILALSGYGLYYLVDDQWRSAASTLHWLVGLCAMAVVVAHAILGKQSAHARLRSGGMARSELRRQHHPARHKVSE